MAKSRIPIPPYARLIVLLAIGLALFLMAAFMVLQPPDGLTANPIHWRAIGQTSPAIWVSLGTGFLAYLISAWVWSLKPSHLPAILFAASGLMTLGFCFSAVGFDLALDLTMRQFMLFANTNALTAATFGIIMPCLFLIYPNRLPGWKLLSAVVVLGFGGWTLFSMFGPVQDFDAVQRITFFEMLVIVAVVGWQVWASREDPRLRAIAIWLGVSTLLGAGAFISLVAAPITFGYPPVIEEKIAFAFFLVIYVGLAVGILRYRLFDLGAWAYRLTFYVSAACVLIILDLALVSFLALDQGQAIGVSLLVVALAYLPLRDLVWHRLLKPKRRNDDELFQRVLDAALKPTSRERAESWEDLLVSHFRPLQSVPIQPDGDLAYIDTEGLSLYVPAAGDASALLLQYPDDGRALFSPEDVALARQLTKLLKYAKESRDAYDRGASEERTRIARDIHDNIGAQLMRALHSERTDRKDTMIRETLADLRDVINNAQSQSLPLDDVLADLRAETAERLEPHQIDLVWTLEAGAGITLPPAKVHALRSFIREAASNTIKHASAQNLFVEIDVAEEETVLRIRDDGKGFAANTALFGHGLGNMKVRVESMGGQLELKSDATGTELTAHIPVHAGPTQAATV